MKYQTFDKNKFLHDLDQELLKGAIYQNNEEIYLIFTRIFQNVLNRHAPLRQKKVRGNHASFMAKILAKQQWINQKQEIGILNVHQVKTFWLWRVQETSVII